MQEIESSTDLKVFKNVEIDLNKIIDRANTDIKGTIHNVIRESTIDIDEDNSEKSLRSGVNFKDIIRRARKFAKYENLENQIVVKLKAE